ncbi:hypothetical protein ALNOE001_20370 [Candidatus Methanobinarius endosymbioticus]|uniref:Right handed beta helix domain-containing protein n=1 Tax=Candidatus Methanobinarius endosymbioticus TaxID=2006182 RepID=A0A366M8E0_9EURY|nr:hypothetical protein ALNOE001_20370 [Candidatus Methanobinarius endosymbioticus]
MKLNLNKKFILFLGFIVLFFALISSSFAASTEIGTNTSGGIKSVINNDNYDTIYLKEGTYKGSDNTNLSVDRTKDITIIGKNNKVIIDGEGKNWLLQFGNYSKFARYNVRLINITFQNGYALDGAVIYHQGENSSSSVQNCKFSNNVASDGYDGAICFYTRGNDSNLQITDSVFTENKFNSYIS